MTELLAPCGNMNTLMAAVSAGADAVYFGAEKFSARAFAENFTDAGLCEAVSYAAGHGVKAYIALNTLVTDREMTEALEIAAAGISAGANAFILQDLGLAAEIRRRYPDAVLHASTQMTACTASDVNALAALGFSRVVLARELSFEEIKKIAAAAGDAAELEVFVHGTLCSSYSGQCLMSSFIGGRSANRGKCAAPCRLPYSAGKKRGKLLSMKDLCLLDYVSELSPYVSSLKIEGRMKGEDYVREVVGAYRVVLDGGVLSPKRKRRMLGAFNRGGYTDGYFPGNFEDMYV